MTVQRGPREPPWKEHVRRRSCACHTTCTATSSCTLAAATRHWHRLLTTHYPDIPILCTATRSNAQQRAAQPATGQTQLCARSDRTAGSRRPLPTTVASASGVCVCPLPLPSTRTVPYTAIAKGTPPGHLPIAGCVVDNSSCTCGRSVNAHVNWHDH